METDFKVETVKLDDVQPHPNADLLEVAWIRGWSCVVKKDLYKKDQTVVYFPLDSILEKELSDRLNCTQYLSSAGRIKAARLRGILSCGLVHLNEGDWCVGVDLTEHYKVKKYEPPPAHIPMNMGGQNAREYSPFIHYTKVKNFNNYPNVIKDGEEVVMAEKIHGTNWRAGMVDGEFYVGSHYFAKKPDEKIVYWQAAYKHNVEEKVRDLTTELQATKLILFGEVYGVQDLRYGISSQEGIELRLFDIFLNDKYVDYDVFVSLAEKMEIPICPERFRGPFCKESLPAYSEGKAFQGDHIREGVVIRPVKERWDYGPGRVILKKINPEYLLRRKGTEFH